MHLAYEEAVTDVIAMAGFEHARHAMGALSGRKTTIAFDRRPPCPLGYLNDTIRHTTHSPGSLSAVKEPQDLTTHPQKRRCLRPRRDRYDSSTASSSEPTERTARLSPKDIIDLLHTSSSHDHLLKEEGSPNQKHECE